MRTLALEVVGDRAICLVERRDDTVMWEFVCSRCDDLCTGLSVEEAQAELAGHECRVCRWCGQLPALCEPDCGQYRYGTVPDPYPGWPR